MAHHYRKGDLRRVLSRPSASQFREDAGGTQGGPAGRGETHRAGGRRLQRTRWTLSRPPTGQWPWAVEHWGQSEELLRGTGWAELFTLLGATGPLGVRESELDSVSNNEPVDDAIQADRARKHREVCGHVSFLGQPGWSKEQKLIVS